MRLSSTSALVLLWAGQDCYDSKRARQYLCQLDLMEGKVIHQQCRDVWPHYDEVIKNRKFGVLTLIDKCCSEKVAGQQMVIAGAGLDALGIDVTSRYPHITVFEIDQDNMRLKSGLHAGLENDPGANIHFIEMDLLDNLSLAPRLTAHGWNAGKPTVLIMEGISYYLPPEAVQDLVQVIKPNRIIFEFLKHERDIAAERAVIPGKIFDTIANQCALPHIRRYDYAEVEELFTRSVADKYSMKRLERMRTGENRYFLTDRSGWIEVCLLIDPAARNSGGRNE